MMLKLLVYAYAAGVLGSRKIARKIDEDVAFRVLAGGNRPDFRAINSFRGEQLEMFKKLFIEVVRRARRAGLLKLGTVALDGAKVKANASKPQAQRNFTDPESSIMKTGQGFEPCYNAPAAVEAGKQLVVAATVGANAADNGYLSELLDGVKNNTGRQPRRVLAAAGNKGETNFEEFERRKMRGCVALGRETSKGGETQTKAGGEAPARLRKRPRDVRGRARYRGRKALLEPAFGWVKRVLGFREFSMRGFKKAPGEGSLVTAALNLRRRARMEPPPQPAYKLDYGAARAQERSASTRPQPNHLRSTRPSPPPAAYAPSPDFLRDRLLVPSPIW